MFWDSLVRHARCQILKCSGNKCGLSLRQSGSYASDEIAINWNAPIVYLFSAIEAKQKYLNYLYNK